MEADGAHFLGTIITLNQTTDGAASVVLKLIDGQQRMTTPTLLLAATHSILKDHWHEMDDKDRKDVTRQENAPNIWLHTLASGQRRRLTANPEPAVGLGSLAWSPHSDLLSYTKQSNTVSIWMIENFK